MASTQKREIPWADIGEPLADLLRYERRIGLLRARRLRFAVSGCP